MRSPIGLASAVIFLAAVPVAFAAQLVSDGSAELVIHLAIGLGSLLLAVAMFDFALPRWVTWLGAAAAAAFGSIFLLQALSQLVPNETLEYVAFDVLGQAIERVLPDVVLVWFGALLLWGSQGRTRIIGLIAMSIVVAVEVAAVASLFLDAGVGSQKVLFLLPFVWLLGESLKPRPERAPDRRTSTQRPATSQA